MPGKLIMVVPSKSTRRHDRQKQLRFDLPLSLKFERSRQFVALAMRDAALPADGSALDWGRIIGFSCASILA
jgi:hypothetical protein